MRRICLTLPTNRECAATLSAVAEEAAYAAAQFGVEVYLLILDSSGEDSFAKHADVLAGTPRTPNVVFVHLGEAAQRVFLERVIRRAKVADRDLIAELMLPAGVSYGACTNRAFLIGSALGCESIHRRDSDSHYQVLDGVRVFPIRHELLSLGKPAAEAAAGVSEVALDSRHADRTVVMVGASFVGELSVDISAIQDLDRDAYYDIVSLWASEESSDEEKRQLVDDSFVGAGTEAFTRDHSALTIVDPMRVDMCNISFHRVHEEIPLPPATDTIGSDYFLIHLVHDARLPGVLHNRNIVNFYTAERRSDAGFIAYQLRLTKFFLSMLYFHSIYQSMALAGESLLDERQRVRVSSIVRFARESTSLDRKANVDRLDSLDRSYRKLGGAYAAFADVLAARREQLLDEAERDIEYFAQLAEAWEPLVRASKAVGPDKAWWPEMAVVAHA